MVIVYPVLYTFTLETRSPFAFKINTIGLPEKLQIYVYVLLKGNSQHNYTIYTLVTMVISLHNFTTL